MFCIRIENTDPFFCLAAEEYLLKHFEADIFMLWQSENTVVVGKHQNLLAEINYPFCRENGIRLARRISGGGTVFHDAGNVNFTFIKNVKSPAEISFKQFTAPVVDALAALGIEATTSGRNDLLVNGLKISGNAEHVYKNRVLHHGTLLFNSDLKNLGQAIKVVPGRYESKAVQSNRSKVGNISSFLKNDLSLQEFIRFLFHFQKEKKNAEEYKLSENDILSIQKLADEKFIVREWIFGYSPHYAFQNRTEIESKILSVQLETEKGIIRRCLVSGTYFNEFENRQLSTSLLNRMHCFEDVSESVKRIIPVSGDELIYLFF